MQISYVLCFVWHNPFAKFDERVRDPVPSFFSRSFGATNLTSLPAPDFAVSLFVDFVGPFEWRASLFEVTATLGLVRDFLLTWAFLRRLSGDSCLAFFPPEDLLYFPSGIIL